MATLEQKIDQNRRYAHLLGWRPSDFGGTDFNATLIAAIEAQQALLNLPVDGISGPRTYGGLLRATQEYLVQHPTADRLKDAGVIAFCAAKIDWLGNVLDLPDRSTADYEHDRLIIDRMIRTMDGLDWSWQPPYAKNFEWCGAATSSWWRKAGLRHAIAQKWFASTLRLENYSHYTRMDAAPNPKPDAGPYRMVIELDEHSTPGMVVFEDGTWPREGDILMMGMAHSAYGTHIATVEDFDPGSGMFTTIEGNGTGLAPSGSRQHGIVRALRPTGIAPGYPATTYHARRVIRPALSDLQ